MAADVNEGALATLADTTQAHPLRLDVSDSDAWVAALQHIVHTYGQIDIAHLNAGIMTKSEGRDEDADVADCLTFDGYRRIRGVNCDGPALGAIALIPPPYPHSAPQPYGPRPLAWPLGSSERCKPGR